MLQEGHQIPIGAKFCFPHLKSENNVKNNGKDSSTPSTRKDTAQLMHESSMEPDADFVPDVSYISSSDLESSLLISESLSATLETSPLLFQIKKKKVSDLIEGTKLKLKQKFLRTQKTLKKKFAEAVAPGQTEEFINDVLKEYTNEDEVPGDIQHALNYYEESDALGKMVILALLDHHKYSKEYIMEVFNCSKYRIEQAREMVSSKNLMIFPEKKRSRCRMDMQKVEHFVDFIFCNG